MGAELQRQIQEALKDTGDMILACKAKRGYKFRDQFHCTDVELQKILEKCEAQLRAMTVSLVLAEAMLREPAPSIHSRWEDYQERRADMIAELVNR